jgi:hypothetical protein
MPFLCTPGEALTAPKMVATHGSSRMAVPGAIWTLCMTADVSDQAKRYARSVPPQVLMALGEYRRWQRFWYSAHYVIGLFAATAGAYTATGVSWGWSVSAAIGTALVTFLGPLQKASSYKHAYYRLRTALTTFEAISSKSDQWLINEYKAAQQIVLTGDPSVAGQANVEHPAPAP